MTYKYRKEQTYQYVSSSDTLIIKVTKDADISLSGIVIKSTIRRFPIGYTHERWTRGMFEQINIPVPNSIIKSLEI